ncbi:hypothetical protein Ddye_006609 [Dipteronia dyeriana]|uniref:Uncharacterized protein n=1 Tax=Dipteronia dyeriana TaxID=168575 RepID=A0AAD9XIA9_9ROSI|nr:hypothetical protein Ddye_006609 [Dipteronia dyeriana]
MIESTVTWKEPDQLPKLRLKKRLRLSMLKEASSAFVASCSVVDQELLVRNWMVFFFVKVDVLFGFEDLEMEGTQNGQQMEAMEWNLEARGL